MNVDDIQALVEGKEKVFCVWEAAKCPSQDTAFISKISKLIKAGYRVHFKDIETD